MYANTRLQITEYLITGRPVTISAAVQSQPEEAWCCLPPMCSPGDTKVCLPWSIWYLLHLSLIVLVPYQSLNFSFLL